MFQHTLYKWRKYPPFFLKAIIFLCYLVVKHFISSLNCMIISMFVRVKCMPYSPSTVGSLEHPVRAALRTC